MIYALFGLVAFLASALVATTVGNAIAAGKHLDRAEREKAAMFRVLTARLVTDELGPGAELRALRLLARDARAATPAPHTNGDEWDGVPIGGEYGVPGISDEMIDRHRRRLRRDQEEGVRDDSGRIITPTGMD